MEQMLFLIGGQAHGSVAVQGNLLRTNGRRKHSSRLSMELAYVVANMVMHEGNEEGAGSVNYVILTAVIGSSSLGS